MTRGMGRKEEKKGEKTHKLPYEVSKVISPFGDAAQNVKKKSCTKKERQSDEQRNRKNEAVR